LSRKTLDSYKKMHANSYSLRNLLHRRATRPKTIKTNLRSALFHTWSGIDMLQCAMGFLKLLIYFFVSFVLLVSSDA
jgi:hypothetical protein